ncbi:tRNA pseudouridine(55) synthase TruB [Candidatus Mycoplasma mahonii]|uniref:tRNA pseudouridine(55) synthase TruB n=1 Tax=Candidatus Mycoplasma mahonii TaxID=3004105 RepID=UPI0026F19995|nr:tRNA pseudouridine(55) synthase TruB [Candidatus Mycoplasma mahonii]WKX02734.1 tRNA pseudouridine(55) synthase TruB [Candidatus Mycoplasma mahonii]
MFYLIDKPKGMTSFKTIKQFARDNHIQKIGHTGTLDPLATGLLLVASDDDTKLIDYIDKGFKTYHASLELGKTSDTYDVDGNITITNQTIPAKELIVDTINSFVCKQQQMPPIFSAKQVNGQRAYDLARKDQVVALKSVAVEVKSITNIHVDKIIEFDIEVSRGTYIRSIIHDLGTKLGCGAIMSDLRRTSIGDLTTEDIGKKINIFKLLTIPIIRTPEMQELIQGKRVKIKKEDGLYALQYKDDIFGIVEVTNNVLIGKKLFGNKFNQERF